jgi:FAD synthase
MAVKVIVPNPNYSEFFVGVEFKNGVGLFEDEKLGKEIAETFGYKVEPVEEVKAEPKKAAAKKAPKKKAE